MEKYVDHKAGSSITLGSTVFALNLIACRTFASSKASLSHMLTSHPGLALLCCDYVFAFMCGVHLLFGQFGRTYINLCSDKCHKCLKNVRCPTAISSPVMIKCIRMIAATYVNSADQLSSSLRKNLAKWVVTWRTFKKPQIGGWALAQDNTVRARLETPPYT